VEDWDAKRDDRSEVGEDDESEKSGHKKRSIIKLF
jgi:hypothetical protein